jgi:hypothetical protein
MSSVPRDIIEANLLKEGFRRLEQRCPLGYREYLEILRRKSEL